MLPWRLSHAERQSEDVELCESPSSINLEPVTHTVEQIQGADQRELNLPAVTLHTDTKSDVNGRSTTSIADSILLLWSCFTLYLFCFDVSSDSYLADMHIRNNNIYWGVMTIIFIVLPIIVNCIRDIYEEIQYSDGSLRSKCLLVTISICMAPMRSFNMLFNRVIANMRGEQITENTLRVLGLIRLGDAMLEALPQSALQIFVMIVQRKWTIWILIKIAITIISLASSVSTNSYLFHKVPRKTMAVFFFIGNISLFSRLWVFSIYVITGLKYGYYARSDYAKDYTHMWLVPVITMLSATIGVWFIKRFCYSCCCKYILPLAANVHHRRNSCGSIMMTWFLTASYNGFNLTGLFLSAVNMVLALGLFIQRAEIWSNVDHFTRGPVYSKYGLLSIPMIAYYDTGTYYSATFQNVVISVITITVPTISVLINLILVAVPQLRHIGNHWLSVNDDGETILF